MKASGLDCLGEGLDVLVGINQKDELVTCSKPLINLLDEVSDKQGVWAIINVLGFKVVLVLGVDGKRTTSVKKNL